MSAFRGHCSVYVGTLDNRAWGKDDVLIVLLWCINLGQWEWRKKEAKPQNTKQCKWLLSWPLPQDKLEKTQQVAQQMKYSATWKSPGRLYGETVWNNQLKDPMRWIYLPGTLPSLISPWLKFAPHRVNSCTFLDCIVWACLTFGGMLYLSLELVGVTRDSGYAFGRPQEAYREVMTKMEQ